MAQFLNENEPEEVFGGVPVLSGSIRVTRACPLKCPHCYVYTTPESGNRLDDELTTEEIKSLIDQFQALGCGNLFITGGEPFIRKDIVEIYRYTAERGMQLSTSTSGTTFTEKTAEALKGINWAMFQVSLDGPEEVNDRIRGKGVFQKACRTIELMVKHEGNNRTIGVSLSAENANAFHKLIDIADIIEATHFSITLVVSTGRAAAMNEHGIRRGNDLKKIKDGLDRFFRDYLEKKPRFKFSRTSTVPIALIPREILEREDPRNFMMCSFPYILGVEADGRAAPCDGFFNLPEYIVGNVREQGLEILWKHPLFAELRSIKPQDLRGVCSVCKWAAQCYGGCRASAAVEFGDIRASDPVCQLMYDAGLFPEDAISPEALYVPPEGR